MNMMVKDTLNNKTRKLRPPMTISSYTLGTSIDFESRVKVAKEAGFEGIGLREENYIDALTKGLDDQAMLDILERYQMKVTEVEYITSWGRDEDRTPEQRIKEQTIYHMARLFDVKHINCGLLEKLPEPIIVKSLSDLCHRAEELIIGLEFMPYSGVPDLQTAWRLAEASRCSNAMLICDTWHWARAKQTYDMLAQVPSEKIVSLQFSDVIKIPYQESREESLHDRMAPGTGFGDTVGFARILKEHGVNPRVISVETISDNLVAKGEEVAAKVVYKGFRNVLEQAWPEFLPK